MILQPTLIPIPEDETLTGPQRVARQRAYARAALDECARRCGAGTREWTKNANGVPQPTDGHHWSISHKPLWVAAAIADRPVGIDIEHLKPRRTNLFDQVGTADDWSVVGEPSWPGFFRIWTAKEAVLKANGVGIGKLSVCRVVAALGERGLTLEYEGQAWQVEHFIHADHIAAITANEDAVIWHVLPDPDIPR